MTPEQFYAQYLPYAQSVSRRTGLDPRLVLAQSALETGYGKSAPNMNFFGIKSHGRKGGSTLGTQEFEGGRMVQQPASFRGYETPEQSFTDYGDFITSNPRYKGVLEADGLEAQIAAMAKSGYATDPDYGSKLASIASRFDPNSPKVIAAETMGLLGKGPQTATTGTQGAAPMMQQEQKPRGLLGSLGIQKMEEGAEGETGQRFYNRDSFKDTAAILAQGFGRMGIMGMEEIADSVANQRTENKARNKTAEYLDKYMPGAGDLVREGYFSAKDALSISMDKQSRELAQQAATALREGNNQEAMAILTQLSPTAMGQQLATQMKPRSSEVIGGGRYTVDYGQDGKPQVSLNEEVIAAEQRIQDAERKSAPLPSDARKSEESDFTAIEAYDNLIQDIGGIASEFGYDPSTGDFEGALRIGLGGLISGGLGALGVGKGNVETAKARQQFDRFKTRLVNESLRLNKGVQTEGDAQRVARELGDAKTEATAYAAVQELLRINQRARANKVAAIERRRSRFGVGGVDIPAPATPSNIGWKVIDK